ncbi:MAG: DUF3341 domain-containing protein [Verrucomicrobiota bacterium]|nr:DUF3341 domain-containing protein [Verrucomicrobiota bacterium]
MTLDKEKSLYAFGAEFSSSAELYHAAEKVRDTGFKRWDTFSPFPIHGMEKAMGLGHSYLSSFSLVGGITGLLVALTLVVYPSVIEYPLITGGKPYFSLPAFFPIIFEITILLTAFATMIALFGLNLLPRWNHPVFNWDLFNQKANDDGFFLVIEARDRNFSINATSKLLEDLGGTNITPIYWES